MVHVTTSYNKLPKDSLQKDKEEIKMRRPSVTRDIKTLNITVLGMDVNTSESITKTYPIYASEAPKDEAKLFNYVRKMYETDEFKIAAITDKTSVVKTYTMPLAKYIEEAEVIEEVDLDKTAEVE